MAEEKKDPQKEIDDNLNETVYNPSEIIREKVEKEQEERLAKIPSFFSMVKSFSKDLHKFVSAGAPICDTDTYADRLATCNDCDTLRRKEKRCGACGCYVQTKARMRTAYCPLGKWENGLASDDPNAPSPENNWNAPETYEQDMKRRQENIDYHKKLEAKKNAKK